jgi:hypothetical protein
MSPVQALRSAGPFVLAAAILGAACTDSFPNYAATGRFLVETSGAGGSRAMPLPLSFDASMPVTVKVTALLADGSLDTSFNGFVRLSVKPGTVSSVTGDGIDGRNVKLTAGVSAPVAVRFAGAYGPAHLWAEDVGYVPVDPTRTPPPQCSDGLDNDGDGLIDFPADPGCAFANDDTEEGGTYVAAASPAIYFALPRIADVRGVVNGGAATSFPHDQVQIDCGYRPDTATFAFDTVVTRISSDGFYATDLGDTRGFTSVFAFNFSTPPQMRVCDRLRGYAGTAADFFGFTEIGYPTWDLEEWDPTVRKCLVPPPYPFKPDDLPVPPQTTTFLLDKVASLVRVASDGTAQVHVSKHFGPGYPAAPDFVPTDDASDCDYNKDGKVDFGHDPEKTCANNCDADPDCTEFSNFLQHNAFRLVIAASGAGGSTGAILADGSTSAQFDPLALKGKPVRAFTGTMRYFNGGNQFTIEARCEDDIVVDMSAAPIPSDEDYDKTNTPLDQRRYACVHARTILDNSSASN